MINVDKLKSFASELSDAELVDAVKHLNDVKFSDDNVIRRMFNYAYIVNCVYSADDRFIVYLPSITKVLCDEATERMRIYSPYID